MKKETKIHSLKTWTEYFNAVINGEKKFEVRKNDRNFSIGDYVILNEYNPNDEMYTGYSSDIYKITYILHGGSFGIMEGYVVLSLTL